MTTKNEQTGQIGEKLVEIELLKRNINFWSMDYHNPCFDLLIDKNGILKKVQIKTSKPNSKNRFQFYLKNCIGGYDYLILVGIIDKDFKNNIFYIISKEELSKVNLRKCILTPQTGINICYKNGLKYEKNKDNWKLLCN